jgi:hypothetical protein
MTNRRHRLTLLALLAVLVLLLPHQLGAIEVLTLDTASIIIPSFSVVGSRDIQGPRPRLINLFKNELSTTWKAQDSHFDLQPTPEPATVLPWNTAAAWLAAFARRRRHQLRERVRSARRSSAHSSFSAS